MKRKLPEKFFEQNQRAKTRKWKFFNLNQALWGADNREFRKFASVFSPHRGFFIDSKLKPTPNFPTTINRNLT